MTARGWNVASGDWNTAANWTPTGIPGDTDILTIAAGTATAHAPIKGQSITLSGTGTLQLESAGASTVGSIVNGGTVSIDDAFDAGGTTLTITGTLTNTAVLELGNVYKDAGVAKTLVIANAINNASTGRITLFGPTGEASVVVHSAAGFGTAGEVSGTVQLIGAADITFDSGAITSIASGGALVLESAAAQMLIAPDTTGNTALTTLATNAGTLNLYSGATLELSGDYTNSSLTYIDNNFQTGGSTFKVDGTFTNTATGEVDLGNLYNDAAHPAARTSVTFGGLENAGNFYLNTSAAVGFVVAGPLDNTGTLVIGTGNALALTGALSGTGTIRLQTGGIFAFGGDVAPSDLSRVTNQGGELVFGPGSVFNAGGQVIDVGSSGLYQAIGLLDVGSIVNAIITVDGGRFDLDGGVLGGLLGSVSLNIASAVQQKVSGNVLLNGTLDNEGTVTVDTGDLLQVEGDVTGTGAFALVGTASLRLDGVVSAGQTITIASGTLTIGDLTDFHATIDGLSSSAKIDLLDITHQSGDTATVTSGNLLTITQAGGATHTIKLDPTQDFTGRTFTLSAASPHASYVTEDAVACFCTGTAILTDHGERAVEDLCVGDRVVTMSGEVQPIVWIGHRRVDCRAHPRPETVWPVRVEAGAFGLGLPQRELWLSPGHAVLVEGTLLPVDRLINGATVTAIPVDSLTYWHVELPRHDVILANGAPTESYLDTGNRNAFENGGGALQLHPDFSSAERIDVRKSFPVSRASTTTARAKVLGVAERLGYTLTSDVDFHIVADGVSIVPSRVDGSRTCFDLPSAYDEAWLVSPTFVPAQVRPNVTDQRCLGVRLSGLWQDGDAVPLANLPSEGWHKPETARGGGMRPARWTDGRGRLPNGAHQFSIELIRELRAWVRGMEFDHDRRRPRVTTVAKN
jgi:hypothetical protein